MPDKTLICQNCHQEFVFSEGEQKFYQEKDLKPPKHCRICRTIYKSAQKHPPKPDSNS